LKLYSRKGREVLEQQPHQHSKKMSSLFTGPRSITPWISTSVFDAILGNPVEHQQQRKPKLVQVIATAVSTASNNIAERTFPRVLRVSDGQTHIAAVLTDSVWNHVVAQQQTQLNEGGNLLDISRGVVVCITDWCVYPADVAVNMSLSKSSPNNSGTSEAWLQWIQDSGNNDNSSTHNTATPAPQVVLLISGSVQVLGGQGLGTVGVPYDVHAAVDVRRAFGSSKQGWQEQLLLSANSTNKTVTNINTSDNGNGKTDGTTGSTTTATPAADLPVGDVAVLFSSNNGGEAFTATISTTATTTTTTVAAAVRKQPPRTAASATAQLSVQGIAPTAPAVGPSHNQSPDLDLGATATAAEADLNAMHDLFSNVIEAGKAHEAAYDYTATMGTTTIPTTTATTTATTTSVSALPIPVVAFTDLAHNALPEESPRKESANGPAAQEVMSPAGGRRRVLEDDDEEEEDDDEQNMGISDMLISETQESAMEQQDESQNETLVETEEDEDSEQGLETQQAAPMDSHENLHAQSNNVAGIAAATSPGTATTAAAAQANETASRKRRQYFHERIDWVNMDLVELGIVAVPRTVDTPMLTMEKLWRHMASSSSIPRKQPPSRTESTTSELGGDSIRAMFLGGSD
jgi:hypothetical protein